MEVPETATGHRGLRSDISFYCHCERSEAISSLPLRRLYLKTASPHREARSDDTEVPETATGHRGLRSDISFYCNCERSEAISSLPLCRLYLETASGHRVPRSDIWGRWRLPRPLRGLAVTPRGGIVSPFFVIARSGIPRYARNRFRNLVFPLLGRNEIPHFVRNDGGGGVIASAAKQSRRCLFVGFT